MVNNVVTVVAEPVYSLFTLLFDAVEDLFEDSFDLLFGKPLSLLEVRLIRISNLDFRLRNYGNI